jgi:hypothetical protein
VTWHLVGHDVECLHVERNDTMTFSGSHLYKFYRYPDTDYVSKSISLLILEEVKQLIKVLLNS